MFTLKLSFRGHVYLEIKLPWSCLSGNQASVVMFTLNLYLRLALTYLKENDHLYSDVVINVGQILSSLLSLTEPVDTSDHETSADDVASSQIQESENQLDAHRLGAHETTLACNMSQSEDLTIAPGKGKQPISTAKYLF